MIFRSFVSSLPMHAITFFVLLYYFHKFFPFFFLLLYIQYAGFRQQQNAAGSGQTFMQGFAPRIHPRQACSLDCTEKLRFAFHQPCRKYSHVKHSAATSKLLSGSSRPTHPAACLSVPAPQSPASPQPPLRQHIPVLILVLSTSPPFHATKKKETDFAGFHLFFFFSYNSNPSISFAISFTALLAVQSVYSSAQATQWSYMNATRSPVSLILALISAIFFSSSFFNSF